MLALRSSNVKLERRRAEVAQLVEHVPEEHGVGGSSPPLGTNKELKDFLSTPHHRLKLFKKLWG